MWKQALRDRFLWVIAAVLLLLWLPYGLPFDYRPSAFAFQTVSLVLAIAATSSAFGARPELEQRFWRLLTYGLCGWLSTHVLEFLIGGQWRVDLGLSLIGDGGYVLLYTCSVLAIELRPHAPEEDVHGRRRSLAMAGALLFVVGLALYFIGCAVVVDREIYDSWIPSLSLFCLLDLYLLARLASLVLSVQDPRWRAAYVGLLSMVAGWAILDGTDLLDEMGVLANPLPTPVTNGLWFVTPLLAAAAARLQLLTPAGNRSPSRGEDFFQTIWGGPWLVNALVFLGVLLLGHLTAVQDARLAGVREVIALLFTIALLFMAGWSQRLVARENQRLAEEQRRLNERVLMAQRLEALGKLAGGVAHDFNNVLQVIQACAENLGDAAVPGSPAARDALQITQAAERAAGLTARLLSLARERAPERTTFELNAAVSRTVDMLRRIIGEDITIETQLSPRAGAITADRGQFEHVLLNLGVNARDAMPGGGRIRIQTAPREVGGRRHAQLVMQDTGMGMDEGTRARIFEPFFTTKLDGRGTGLGLTMAKSFLQALGGTIEVESALGFGSTFRLLLPAATEACEDEPLPTRAATMRAASVLVVEDEGPVRTVICGYLRDGGFQVLEAANGTEALEVLARSSRPDLVLTDLVMPAMGGAELHARIDTVYTGLPVVFMTGYAPDGLGVRSQRVLRKPFARAELEQLLREELGPIRGVGEG